MHAGHQIVASREGCHGGANTRVPWSVRGWPPCSKPEGAHGRRCSLWGLDIILGCDCRFEVVAMGMKEILMLYLEGEINSIVDFFHVEVKEGAGV